MTGSDMTDLRSIAADFLERCETGQGWDACCPFCTDDAGFSAQAEPVADLTSLAAYTEWMHDLFSAMPDARYDLRALALDPDRPIVIAFAAFIGTHSGDGGPVPPTGRRTESDYAYVMRFTGDRISHLTKVWNAGWAMRELGWD